jgi:hypothetical protein
MSLLRRLTGKDRQSGAEAREKQGTEAPEPPPCPHTALVPRWDSIEDMGKEEKATSYFCQGCERTFTVEEAQQYLR